MLQESKPFPYHDLDMDGRLENVDEFLFLNLGFSSKINAWAGPDHWKYLKSKGSEAHLVSEDGPALKSKKPKTKRQAELDLRFHKFSGKNVPNIFCRTKNPKSLLQSQPHSSTKLPEGLAKLFLLPNCLGRRARKFSDGPREQCNDYGSFSSWDDRSVCGAYYDGDVHSDNEDSSTLISQPRQVNKIEVHYDKTSKQVNVQALKNTLWSHNQEYAQLPIEGEKEMVSFR